MNMPVFPLIQIPLPIILTEPAIGVGKNQFRLIMAMVAKNLDTFAIMPREAITDKLMPYAHYLMPQYSRHLENR